MTRSLFCKSVRPFLVKMSLRRALLARRFRQRYGRISATVRLYWSTVGMAFSKTGRRFVYKRYYRSKSKSKAVLRVSGTVVLQCENRHIILTGTVVMMGGEEFCTQDAAGKGCLPLRLQGGSLVTRVSC